MSKNFAHVNTKINVFPRERAVEAPAFATSLFAPFYASKGPENQIVKITSNTQFSDTFGSLNPAHGFNGISEKIIQNWLGAYGVVYALRITDDTEYGVQEEARTIAPEDFLTATPVKLENDKLGFAIHTASTPYVEGSDINSNGLYVIYKTNLDDVAHNAKNNYYYKNGTLWIKVTYNADAADTDAVSTFHINTGIKSITRTVLNSAISYTVATVNIADALNPDIDGQDKIVSLGEVQETVRPNIAASNKVDGILTNVKARYSGSFYNNVTVNVVNYTDGLTITIYAADNKRTPVEIISAFRDVTKSGSNYIVDLTSYSEIIGSLTFSANPLQLDSFTDLNAKLLNGADTVDKDLVIHTSTVREALVNKLDTPIDVILDPGFPAALKEDYKKLCCTDPFGLDIDTLLRNDIFLYLSAYEVAADGVSVGKAYDPKFEYKVANGTTYDFRNAACYGLYATIKENGKDVKVFPNVALAAMIPANDVNNGPQHALAGIQRGKLPFEVTGVSKILKPSDKNAFIAKGINYFDVKGTSAWFWSQRTGELEDKATNQISASRALLRMEREIVLLVRKYNFALNDYATVSQVQAEVDAYLSDWVANRTLSEASAIIESDGYDTLNVTISIKFTGTIERINLTFNVY